MEFGSGGFKQPNCCCWFGVLDSSGFYTGAGGGFYNWRQAVFQQLEAAVVLQLEGSVWFLQLEAGGGFFATGAAVVLPDGAGKAPVLHKKLGAVRSLNNWSKDCCLSKYWTAAAWLIQQLEAAEVYDRLEQASGFYTTGACGGFYNWRQPVVSTNWRPASQAVVFSTGGSGGFQTYLEERRGFCMLQLEPTAPGAFQQLEGSQWLLNQHWGNVESNKAVVFNNSEHTRGSFNTWQAAVVSNNWSIVEVVSTTGGRQWFLQTGASGGFYIPIGAV
eukprot:gene11821-2278_t